MNNLVSMRSLEIELIRSSLNCCAGSIHSDMRVGNPVSEVESQCF
jgi:hypothetical protein